jgi:spore coat protein U-like protein
MRGLRWLVSLSVLSAALVVGGRSASAQNCTITLTTVPFGIYDVFSSAPLHSTGSLTYHCSGGVATITIWMSKGSGTTNNPRQMVGGTDRLNYYLCQDASCNTLWGDKVYPSDFGPIAPGNGNVTLPIYGVIPAGQDVSAGIYTDTVLVVLNF